MVTMSRQKKVFLIVAAIFLALLLYASYDIGRRTTFPGAEKPDTTDGRSADSLAPEPLTTPD